METPESDSDGTNNNSNLKVEPQVCSTMPFWGKKVEKAHLAYQK